MSGFTQASANRAYPPSPGKKGAPGLKGGARIKVAVRVRPLLPVEQQRGQQCTRIRVNSNQIEVNQ